MIASSVMLSITMERHQSFARCQNGYHISPSGVCELVIQPSTELPRCPNGYYRSPSLVCEQVTPSSSNSPFQNPTSPYQQQQSPQQQQQSPQQQQQQPEFPQQPQQGQQPQYPPQLQQQFQQQPQQNSSGLVQLANESAVIACLNHVLADSISKAGITGSLTLRKNTNGTVTGGLNQAFITKATDTLDACILPRR
jgi:hypothetical protein